MADAKISGLAAITTNATTDEFVVAAGGATKKITQANLIKMLPGYELGYAEITSNGTSTATTAAGATTIITAPSITFDGSTAVLIQFFCRRLSISIDTNASAAVELFEDSTGMGLMASSTTTAQQTGPSVFAVRKLTPSAGAKVYTARLWITSAGTATASAGAGGAAGTVVPAFLRIVRA